MQKLIVLIAAAAFAAGGATGSGATSKGAGAADRSWFERRTQALYDALAPGNKRIWADTIADDFTSTSEDGVVQNRKEFLDAMRPLPPGFTGAIRVRGLTVRDLGGAAVVHYWLDESEDVLGQRLTTTYVDTDTYRREGRSWKMVATQCTVVPRDPEPVAVDSSGWGKLAGEYRLSPRSPRVFRVFLRDGKLYGGATEASAKRLIPLAPTVFFESGSIIVAIFVTDASGNVAEMRELRKYNEIVWRRGVP